MIFADKLMELRKKNGWSQEELAEQMGVSRQSVSKWEAAQSIPDMNKLLKLSDLFGVSMDCLLKDELELPEAAVRQEKTSSPAVRSVSMEEAGAFLAARIPAASRIALGVALCILSPVLLIFLSACSEVPGALLTEDQAGGIGMIVMLLLVAGAVALFLMAGNRLSAYAYLNSEVVETAYGVSGMVKEEMERYREVYNRCNVMGTLLCILAAIPLFLGCLMDSDNDFLIVSMSCVTLVIVSAAVYLFVRVGTRWGSFQRLLQLGDYSVEKKTGSKVPGTVTSIYWALAVALFLVSFGFRGQWEYTGIYWAVAGLGFVPVNLITNLICRKK